MTYRVAVHPSVSKNLKKLYKLDRPTYDYVKARLSLLVYSPEMGSPLGAEFEGKWRIHIGIFVLIYAFNKANNTLTLLTFEHYTRAYDMDTAYA
ncbi:RelE/StbE replicon stabilization toxin [Methanosarcina siciliae T4/M]|uniref:RelE/StbE replicon stabilization toxin n=2 Tax=Methanosarcina siciliae TaxID=38027 RepID=A0A0E3PFC5_9EURY|nr:type II toxin-antitoxin system RelE/ParE family toxin [Methanosarcina siciliae]AKB29476.1 RelE/StbE replicon stabilization toxin [Methanosarcina siciliae T4/M]AKB33412.1 RelE/StbE replicon stabilization toxin [Methanosarcina siciliae HI350]